MFLQLKKGCYDLIAKMALRSPLHRKLVRKQVEGTEGTCNFLDSRRMGILSPLPQQKDEQWRSQEGWGTRDWRHRNIYMYMCWI